jgi:SAM-dependent methyltransferase
VNEAQYTRAYWGQWPADEIYLDAQIRAQQFVKLLCPAPGDTFLDLGGGVGNFANRMCHDFTLSVLCDIARTALRQNTNPGLAKVQGNLLSLPFAEQTFDKILLADVLEHLDATDIPGVLAEVYRVLRPGTGRAVIFTNCRGLRLRPVLLRLRGRVGRGELDWKDLQDGHLNRLANREISTFVAAAGLIIRHKCFFSHVFEPLVTAALDIVRPRHDVASQEGAPDGRERLKRHPAVQQVLRGLTKIMALDLILLGRVPGGGVFLVLERPAC